MVLLGLGIVSCCAVIYWIDYPYHCDHALNGTLELAGSLDCSQEPDATVGIALMVVLAVLSAVIATLNTLGVSGSDMAVVYTRHQPCFEPAASRLLPPT